MVKPTRDIPKNSEQEPVATDWERIARVQDAKLRAMCNEAGGFEKLCEVMDKYERTTPYVATPRPQRTAAEGEDYKAWVGLTDEETAELVHRYACYELARQIEAKLKAKNERKEKNA